MKLAIEHRCTHAEAKAGEKISLTGLRALKNSKGQWVVSFSSANHKYLNVDYNISSAAPCSESIRFEDGSYAFAEGFSIETQETYPDDGCDMPHDSVILWMIPESKAEQEELSGVAAILPSKWSYCACIVPFSDIEL